MQPIGEVDAAGALDRGLQPPGALRPTCAAASASAFRRPSRRDSGAGDLHQPLAQLVEARRRDLVEHLAAALLPLFDHRLADARDGAGRRDRLRFELGE